LKNIVSEKNQEIVTSQSWATLPVEERKRRELRATELRWQYITNPWYAEKDRKFGNEYWTAFYDSRVLW